MLVTCFHTAIIFTALFDLCLLCVSTRGDVRCYWVFPLEDFQYRLPKSLTITSFPLLSVLLNNTMTTISNHDSWYCFIYYVLLLTNGDNLATNAKSLEIPAVKIN